MIRRLPFLVIGMLILSACAITPKVKWDLTITGSVNEPSTFSYQELASLPQTGLENVMMDRSVDEDEIGSWSGVALDDLFLHAGVSNEFSTLTAVASDGYSITVLPEELEGAIIALKKDGEWIQIVDPSHGPIRLVCPRTTASRWVYKLKGIVLNQ